MCCLPILRRLLWPAAVLAVCAGGACTTEARLRQGGATPYVRCLAAPAPEDRVWRTHNLTLTLKDGALRIAGLPTPTHVVAFSGAGFGAPPGAAELASAAASGADLFIMLGGLGQSDAAATATALALAKLPRPVLFVAGGRDSLRRVQHALDALPAAAAVVDASRLRTVDIDQNQFLPIAGAEDGHYAVDEDSCGFGLPDLKVRASELGKPMGRRWLLAWHAPAGAIAGNVALTPAGLDLGAPGLGEFARRVGVAGGLYAWPEAQLGLAPAGAPNAVVPRLFGPVAERTDGSRSQLGFARVELGNDGLRQAR